MNPGRLDLSSLDPSLDPARWERLIDAILHRAGPELVRRAVAESSLIVVAAWARPALAAAAVLAILAAGALFALEPRTEVPALGLPEALGLPPTPADWLLEERGPSLSELMLASEGDLR